MMAGGIPMDRLAAFLSPIVQRTVIDRTGLTGAFDFDFVLAGMSYTVAATDTSGLSRDTVQALLDSTTDGAVAREKLLALANQPGAQSSLLADFGVNSLPQAIAGPGASNSTCSSGIFTSTTRFGC